MSTSESPTTLATSHEIRDRGSTFVGCLYRAQTADEARAALRRHVHWEDSEIHAAPPDERPHDRGQAHAGGESDRHAEGAGRGPESHKGPYAMGAWRCMVLRHGRTGLNGPDDFVVQEGCEDGGERWAGGRVLGVMKREGVLDAVVVVRRWFGGTLLGPVRFAHIETCAGEVCRRFRKIEEMAECVQTLNTLDDLLATLRAELAATREAAGEHDSRNTPGPGKIPDYHAMQDALDLARAKRLIHARECAINATKTLIEEYKTST